MYHGVRSEHSVVDNIIYILNPIANKLINVRTMNSADGLCILMQQLSICIFYVVQKKKMYID